MSKNSLVAPAIVWLTGLSGAGKSTIAQAVHEQLGTEGRASYVLDGDMLRQGLNVDLGFSVEDRSENIRRVAHVAHMMADAGLVVIVALISPFIFERCFAREISGRIRFIEVYVDTPMSLCEQRDPKGLYRKARAGFLSNFTGIDSPYEPPVDAELVIHTASVGVSNAVEAILDKLRQV